MTSLPGARGGGPSRDGVPLAAEANRRAVEAALRRLVDEGMPDRPGPDVVVLDIGGRGRPYGILAEGALANAGMRPRHFVMDAGTRADLMGLAESLPVRTRCVDLALCTQVLEHVADPPGAVREMARVLRPGGACLLTTHGTWFYHPDPEDYWRWTGAGLRRLFVQAGFTSVDVRPVGGTKLALAVLVSTALRRFPGGAFSRAAQSLLAAPVEWVAGRLWIDRDHARRSVEGELVLNYIVTARTRVEHLPATASHGV